MSRYPYRHSLRWREATDEERNEIANDYEDYLHDLHKSDDQQQPEETE